MKHEFQYTKDGSHTLYIPEMDEHYHSSHGAINEALHVYIKNGFYACNVEPVRILEIGFGTGLNAWLTLIEAEKLQRKVEYISYELFPLPKDTYDNLNYPIIHSPNHKIEFNKLQDAEWNVIEKITDCFSLLKKQEDITKSVLEIGFDVVYFDAFAPEKQPEMWSFEMFCKIHSSLKPGGVVVTYCAKGIVRRTMQAAGFKMEKLSGPPEGKREMLRGTK